MGKIKRKPIASRGRRSMPEELQNFGYHLVFSEGTKTEPNYVENIKKIIANNFSCEPGQIEIHPHMEDGTYNTLGLVEYAEQEVKKLLDKGIKIDHVWLFYDKDDFPKDKFDNAYYKIESKNKPEYKNDDLDQCDENGIVWHACWSNEAFELWLLLYFESIRSSMNRSQYITKLNNHLNGIKYEKNIVDIHDLLTSNGGRLELAIRYAKSLDTDSGVKPNPSTGVYKFVEHFYKYINRGK